MFVAPPSVDAELFAKLPEEMRSASAAASAWHENNPGSQPMDSFLEGPCFDGAGKLHCTDIVNGRIYAVTEEGGFRVAAQYDGEPCGLALAPDGRLAVADFKHGLLAFDPRTGRIEREAERAGLERFKGLNDLVFARGGSLYFTDQGLTGLQDPSGRLYVRNPGGAIECVLDGIPSPNGLAFDPTESVLYLAVTRSNAIWRVPLLPHGRPVRVGLHIQLSGGIGPDGLAIDSQGRLYVAHFGLGCVWVFDGAGEPLLRIRAGRGRKASNVCLRETREGVSVFVTEAQEGGVYRYLLPSGS